MKNLSTLLLVFLLAPAAVFGQGIDLVQIFRPGIKLGGEYIPKADFKSGAALADSATFGAMRGNVQIIVPLKSRFEISLKNIDVRAKQSFWTINASYRQPKFSNMQRTRELYSFSTGITGVKAGLRSGLWFYTVQVGMNEDLKTFGQWRPTAGGLVAKLHIASLSSAFIYGIGGFYNNKQFLPVPILGYFKRFSRKSNFMLVLPAQIRFGYTPSKSVRLSWQASPAGFFSGFSNAPDTLFTSKGQRLLMSYRQIKLSMALTVRFSKNARLLLEGGYLSARQIRFSDADNNRLAKYKIEPTPFAGFTLQLNLGKALLDSQDFGVEL
jgi:hypothetical protein